VETTAVGKEKSRSKKAEAMVVRLQKTIAANCEKGNSMARQVEMLRQSKREAVTRIRNMDIDFKRKCDELKGVQSGTTGELEGAGNTVATNIEHEAGIVEK
jgi:hypothetical protein